jgi:hypothetical protein
MSQRNRTSPGVIIVVVSVLALVMLCCCGLAVAAA